MTDKIPEPQKHPANAVFALMDKREFRHAVIQSAVTKDKAGLCRLTTGKYQLKGFRNIAKAPTVMLVPVLSDEANVSADLALTILKFWLEDNNELRVKVTDKLREFGYEPQETLFDEEGFVSWRPMSDDHAQLQYNGKFIDDEEENGVMLMSLLLGWFGSDKEEEEASE